MLKEMAAADHDYEFGKDYKVATKFEDYHSNGAEDILVDWSEVVEPGIDRVSGKEISFKWEDSTRTEIAHVEVIDALHCPFMLINENFQCAAPHSSDCLCKGMA